jgi:molybdopterin/thiamine biosynthesis adenylyltransferase
MSERFDRNERFFGKEGQNKLRALTIAVVGVGGLGTHVIQQLALYGVGGLVLIDHEELDQTNKNRYIGVYADDQAPGARKVDLGERHALLIDPTIRVIKVHDVLVSQAGFDAIRSVDYVFGCLDKEGTRLVLTEFCAAYAIPYFDLATEIITGDTLTYGGRICFSNRGQGCLMCFGVLDVAEAQQDLSNPNAKMDRQKIYGVDAASLGAGSGPSVVSINGVIASLAVTESMLAATGIREAKRLLSYYGHTGKVTVSTDEALANCFFCKGVWGKSEKANVERYLSK